MHAYRKLTVEKQASLLASKKEFERIRPRVRQIRTAEEDCSEADTGSRGYTWSILRTNHPSTCRERPSIYRRWTLSQFRSG
jgi:hypothetical protein